jgi:hypothetical protein
MPRDGAEPLGFAPPPLGKTCAFASTHKTVQSALYRKSAIDCWQGDGWDAVALTRNDWGLWRMVRAAIAAFIGYALLAGAANAEPLDVCALSSAKAAAAILGSAPAPVDPDATGEETAPFCLWATPNRRKSVKLQVWSAAELQVIGVYDAQTYFEKLKTDYAKNGRVQPVADSSDPAFFVETKRPLKNQNFGSVAVLRGELLLIVDFVNVPADKVIELARSAAGKL